MHKLWIMGKTWNMEHWTRNVQCRATRNDTLLIISQDLQFGFCKSCTCWGDKYKSTMEYMHCHVYHEGIAKKWLYDVCSLIKKPFDLMLDIVFENCSDQNETNIVLKIVPKFVQMVSFKKRIRQFSNSHIFHENDILVFFILCVQVFFLLDCSSHKECIDCLFNVLNGEYRHQNIHVMEELIHVFSVFRKFHTAWIKSDFLDLEWYLFKHQW